MIRRLTILALAAAAFLSLGTAFAQNKTGKVNFYEVVPKHEFFFEGFGGFGSLVYHTNNYSLSADRTTPSDPYTPNRGCSMNSIWGPWGYFHSGDPIEFHPVAKDMMTLKRPTGFGYGGGFGYIAHITPTVGIMTGAEFAVYNGGIDLRTEKHPSNLTAEVVETSGEKMMLVTIVNNYREMQKLMSVQVPLMLHLMAPMGKGNNFFYAAIGAKLGINVYGTYEGHGSDWVKEWDATLPGGDWEEAPAGRYMAESHTILLHYGDLPAPNPYHTEARDEEYGAQGKLYLKPVTAYASAEVGFRWKFGGGCGLYTGLYCDFGFLGVNKTTPHAMYGIPSPFDEPDLSHQSPSESQSIINAQGAPDIYVKRDDDTGNVLHRMENLTSAVTPVWPLAAGIKMKIAFGKVKKAAAPTPVVLPPKPDTVVKTVVQTIVVRDTVVQNNTVVIRDTVEKVNTVVVRDTVVVIKEIPQEIKDVMVELSNTLFAFNKFNLTDKAREGLNKVATWLNDNPDVQVEISGHTDSVGSDSYNQKLSEQRAKSVYEYFIHEGGVSSKRLSYKGYGESRTIATNDTDEGRQQNRRVELNIIQ